MMMAYALGKTQPELKKLNEELKRALLVTVIYLSERLYIKKVQVETQIVQLDVRRRKASLRCSWNTGICLRSSQRV